MARKNATEARGLEKQAGKQPQKSKPLAEPYKPTKAEHSSIAAYIRRETERPMAPKVKQLNQDCQMAEVYPDHPNLATWFVLMSEAFGSNDLDVKNYQSRLLMNAVMMGDEWDVSNCNAAFALMFGIQPRDEIESMLAAQMVAVNHAAMTMAGQLNDVQSMDQQNSASNALNKLMRTFTSQLEALNRYRGKGQQKVTVEHVHVHDGGQAIVGTVKGGRGRGGNDGNRG